MNTENIDYETIKWYVIVHLTFVGSAFAMGYLDMLARESETRCRVKDATN